MALGSLLFRARELSARWPSEPSDRLKSVAACLMSAEADGSSARLSASADIFQPAADFDRRDPVLALYSALRNWPLADAAWLATQCAELAERLRSGALDDARPILGSLLKGLPRIQEEITRRIYQEDLNS